MNVLFFHWIFPYHIWKFINQNEYKFLLYFYWKYKNLEKFNNDRNYGRFHKKNIWILEFFWIILNSKFEKIFIINKKIQYFIYQNLFSIFCFISIYLVNNSIYQWFWLFFIFFLFISLYFIFWFWSLWYFIHVLSAYKS